MSSDRPSADVTGGPERAVHRAMLYATGLSEDDLDRPMVGIANPAADVTPCNVHLDRVAGRRRTASSAATGRRWSSGPSPSATPSRWGTRG